MLEAHCHSLYQNWVIKPCIQLLAHLRGVHPHALTVSSGLSGILAAWLISQGRVPLAVTSLLLSGLLDSLDGALARQTEKTSAVGAVLDIVTDRVVEGSVILGLVAGAPEARAWPALWLLFSILICVTSFLVVGIFSENASEKSFHYSPGLIERPEAFVFFILMMLLPGQFVLLAIMLTALIFITALQRVVQFAYACSSTAS